MKKPQSLKKFLTKVCESILLRYGQPAGQLISKESANREYRNVLVLAQRLGMISQVDSALLWNHFAASIGCSLNSTKMDDSDGRI